MPEAVLVQHEPAWEDGPTNRDRLAHLLAETQIAPGSLIVLPEMFAVGFSMNVPAIHEGEQAPNEAFLAELGHRYESWVIGGLVRRDATGRGLNQALAVAPDGTPLARYTKMFPFTFAGESDHYAPGHEVFTFYWQNLCVAPFICFDLRFPEIFRAAGRVPADVLAVIANFPTPRLNHWQCLTQARAIENQAYTLAVNRAGRDPNVAYPGRSRVIDPGGQLVAEAGPRQQVLKVAVDPARLADCRRRFPVLADIRPNLVPPPQTDLRQTGPGSFSPANG